MGDPFTEYNPLDYHNLTVNLVRELMSRELTTLPLAQQFPGAGVYALFYRGDLPVYQPVSAVGADRPIYVGKAVPKGARKGQKGGSIASGRELYDRLRQHASSIGSAENLDLADFKCRFLVVTPLWITMAERFLIEEFQPIWNVCLEGFGIHPPGKGRLQGEIPWWDALHPGRSFAVKLRQTRTREEAEARLVTFFEQQKRDPEAIRRKAAMIAEAEAESEME